MTPFESRIVQDKWYGPYLLQGLVLALFLLFGFRFWYLQVHKGAYFVAKARENRIQSEPIYAPRGIIRDRKGHLLAVNQPAYALAIVREDCRDIEATLAQVSEWTEIPKEELEQEYERGRGRVKGFEPQILVSHISFDLLARIEAHTMKWPELKIVIQPMRFYPQDGLLSHILGYVAQANEAELNKDPSLDLGDTVGKQGLELVLEKTLRGEKGKRQNEVDVVGRNLNEWVIQQPLPGDDVALSIDLELQRVASEQLQGKAGAIVVMDPMNGKLLALVSEPRFNNNEFVKGLNNASWKKLVEDPMHPLQNRAIQSAYPPGSVFKLAVAGAGLDLGEINPKKKEFCPGSYKLGRRVFRCWKREGHGWMDLEAALVQSCDVYFYKLGEKLGVERIAEYARAMGFGMKTGVELPHERAGLIPDKEWKLRRFGVPWQGGETINMSIGQGYVLTTPLQIARFVSSLVNGGVLYRPSLLKDKRPVVDGTIPLTEAHRERIVETMRETVENPRGTAWRLRTEGAEIGGKTGTAQVVKLKDEFLDKETEEIAYKYRDHAWMASYGKKDGRLYVIVAMVEHGGSGGSAAGPPVKVLWDVLFPPEER